MDPLSSPSSSSSSSPSPPNSQREEAPQENYQTFYVLSTNPDIREGTKKIAPFDIAARVFATMTLITVIAIVVLLILGFLGKINPLACLYPIGGTAALLIVLFAIDCCRKAIASRAGIDIQHHDKLKFPKPKKEKKESSST